MSLSIFSSPFDLAFPRLQRRVYRTPNFFSDDDFFQRVPRLLEHHLIRDPMSRYHDELEEAHQRELNTLHEFFKKDVEEKEDPTKKEGTPPQVEYHITKSTTVDKDGKTIKQTKRVYKDNTGRYKAQTERELDGVKRSVLWERLTADGELTKKVLDQLPDNEAADFEAKWKETEFAQDKLKIEQ